MKLTPPALEVYITNPDGPQVAFCHNCEREVGAAIDTQLGKRATACRECLEFWLAALPPALSPSRDAWRKYQVTLAPHIPGAPFAPRLDLEPVEVALAAVPRVGEQLRFHGYLFNVAMVWHEIGAATPLVILPIETAREWQAFRDGVTKGRATIGDVVDPGATT